MMRGRCRRDRARAARCLLAACVIVVSLGLAPVHAVEFTAPPAPAPEPPQESGATEPPPPVASPAPPTPAGRTAFVLRADDLLIPYSVFAIYVDPGETVVFDTVLDGDGREFEFLSEAGTVETLSGPRWRWTAPPEPGLSTLLVSAPALRQEIRIHAFARRSLEEMKAGALNGYAIGEYPDKPLRDNPRYAPPTSLVEVTEDNQDTLVSPHFRVRQFLTKQGGDWPKYVALDERLLLKLEMILGKVREQGVDAPTLHVMSGYRTPMYNRRIGNVPYSRHVYGDGADIFIDVDGNGRMDDLNGDDRSDYTDAKVLAGWVAELFDDPFYGPLTGGLGLYGPKPHRGPFVHVDTRGHAARWEAP